MHTSRQEGTIVSYTSYKKLSVSLTSEFRKAIFLSYVGLGTVQYFSLSFSLVLGGHFSSFLSIFLRSKLFRTPPFLRDGIRLLHSSFSLRGGSPPSPSATTCCFAFVDVLPVVAGGGGGGGGRRPRKKEGRRAISPLSCLSFLSGDRPSARFDSRRRNARTKTRNDGGGAGGSTQAGEGGGERVRKIEEEGEGERRRSTSVAAVTEEEERQAGGGGHPLCSFSSWSAEGKEGAKKRGAAAAPSLPPSCRYKGKEVWREGGGGGTNYMYTWGELPLLSQHTPHAIEKRKESTYKRTLAPICTFFPWKILNFAFFNRASFL